MENQKQAQETKIYAGHTIQGKPLDFSFLKIQDIQRKYGINQTNKLPLIELRKENARSGKRKPIIETDDEEDQKKVRTGAQFADN